MKKWPIMMLALSLLVSATLFAQGSRKTIETGEFTSIGLGLPVTVHVMKGPNKVEVEGPASAVEKMKFENEKGSLNIEREEKMKSWKGNGVTVYVTMPNISGLAIGGSGSIIVKDEFNELGDLNLSIGGSGDIEIAGKAKNVKVSIAGSGDVKASGLSGNKCEVSIAGSGDAKVGEMKALEVSIAGSGDVGYKGEPKVSKSIVGSGGVKKM
ncbi:MAG: DUF2807 domain-containing protein [Lewinellaceae bacterium]|nr:DUF2807 domain-containing protein [Lewinellaceae bacterium]